MISTEQNMGLYIIVDNGLAVNMHRVIPENVISKIDELIVNESNVNLYKYAYIMYL